MSQTLLSGASDTESNQNNNNVFQPGTKNNIEYII